MRVASRGCRHSKETPRVEFFFSAARGRPTYYVIRHQSIYGNSDIIARRLDIFDMISLPSVVYSGFGSPLYHRWLSLHNRGMLQILVNIFQSLINLVMCYKGVKNLNGRLLLPHVPKPFSRTMLLSHSHFNHRCRPVVDKIMNNTLFQAL